VVAKFSYDDGDVVVVEVQPSFNPPVRYKGAVSVRAGARKGIATEADERVLSEKRSSFAQTFDVLPCRESKLDDISVDIFKLTYLPCAIDPEILEANHRNLEIQLSSLKFYDLKHNCPTNAGILMFGKNPRFYMAGAYIQYLKFKGKEFISDDVDFERIFDGDLTTQLRVINDFTKTQIVKMVLPELGGQYHYNFPHIAIKELLFNAIIHKDYRSNAPIKCYEYEDRVEISNPGGLYGLATKENFPSQNDYRNPTLAEAAKKLGYINSFNIGISNARGALTKNGNLPPEFKLDQQTHFSVIIYKKQI
jgi:ATP-dependent DNA helicase RecG